MKLAVIGYGGMAGYHASLIEKRNDIHIDKVYDIDPIRLKKAEKDGYTPCSSAEEIFSDPKTDMVLIATPNDSHFEYGKRALLSGKEVLLEKPAVMRSADWAELAEISRKTGVRLTAHQNRRFDSDYLVICDAVKNETLGKIYRIESNVVAANGIPGEWRKKKSQGGGMIFDWGVHLADQMIYLFGRDVKTVYCRNSYVYGEEVDDGFYCELVMNGGAVCCLTVDTNCFFQKPRWLLFGYDGSGELFEWNRPLVIRKPALSDAMPSGIKAGNGFTKTMAPRSGSTVSESEIASPYVKPDIFYDKLLGCNGYLVPPEDVYYTLRLMEAMNVSAEKECVIRMEDFK